MANFERWTAYKIRKSEMRRRDMQKRRRLRNHPWTDPLEVMADLVVVGFFFMVFSSLSC